MKKITEAGSTNKSFAVILLDRFDQMLLWAWRHFVSLKFSIFLLALIGVASIYGTMGFASNAALGDNSIAMARTHFFESKGFVALLLLFAVNLMFSTWHVTQMSFGIWGKREFRRSPEYYGAGSTPRGELRPEGGIERAEGILRRRYTRVHRDGNAFFAHAGLLSRVGPTIVHAGMLLVIGSISAKAFLIWTDRIVTEARYIGAEGETTHLIHEPLDLAQNISDLNRRERSTGLWIKVLDFDEIKFPNSNTPAYFSSLVEVRDPVTQNVTVAQLDMNHSLKLKTSLGDLQFHQAGYQQVPAGEFERINFDVRNRDTGERIAVTDTHPGNRVRVGAEDLFLEVDGIAPASRWRLYQSADPAKVVAEGLLTGGKQLEYSFKVVRFFTHFTIDPATRQPTNASPEIVNPALEVALFLDGRQVETTWLFADRELADAVPVNHPKFKLELRDVRHRPDIPTPQVDWNKPGDALFVVAIVDRGNGETAGTEVLEIDQTSAAIKYTSNVDTDGHLLGTEGRYEVRLIGPTDRFLTVLSVVNEPTVIWTNIGVAIIVLGAMMTFVVRYRALYGVWDETAGTLRLALVPRWGQSPVREEFDSLVAELTGGRGLLTKGVGTSGRPDESAPAHDTVLNTSPAQS